MDPITRWLRARPPALGDVLLALLVAVVALAGTAAQHTGRGYRHADALAYALAALAALSLAARRRWPNFVFTVVLSAMVVFAARGYTGGPALVTVLVSVYTAASLDTRLRSLALGAIAGVALSAARLIFTTETVGQTATNALGWIGAALFLGWAVANRRAFVAEIRDRAERAERTREEEARRRVDAERLRIAREVHDVVAHSISTINVQAGVAAHVMDRQPQQASEALATIKRLSKEALGELRSILAVLRAADGEDPRRPTAGLAQLGDLLDRSCQAGVTAELAVDGEARPVPVAVDLAAYRIVQEALTNVLRHASTDHARVTLRYRPDMLVVEVTDDGSGAASAFVDGAGHGLLGMRERAESLGGSLDAGPRSDGGFGVRARLPTRGDA